MAMCRELGSAEVKTETSWWTEGDNYQVAAALQWTSERRTDRRADRARELRRFSRRWNEVEEIIQQLKNYKATRKDAWRRITQDKTSWPNVCSNWWSAFEVQSRYLRRGSFSSTADLRALQRIQNFPRMPSSLILKSPIILLLRKWLDIAYHWHFPI